ncbi:MAG: sigR 1 [Planctomycetaceae bacterium]|nr:sigR 1 [Planctomycetaceae bacterium]
MCDEDATRRDEILPLEQYFDWLLMLAQRAMHHRAIGPFDAEDVVQETLLKALAKRGQFRGTTDREFHGWLRKILATEILLAIRKCKRTTEQDVTSIEDFLAQISWNLDNLISSLSSPSRGAMRNELIACVLKALSQLIETQRMAVVLKDIDGKTTTEIEELMGATGPAVAGYLRRGRQSLEVLLLDCMGGQDGRLA